MMQRLVCFHGHHFEVPNDHPAEEIVCPLCGTYQHHRGDLETDDSTGGNRTEDRRISRLETPLMTRGPRDRTKDSPSARAATGDTQELPGALADAAAESKSTPHEPGDTTKHSGAPACSADSEAGMEQVAGAESPRDRADHPPERTDSIRDQKGPGEVNGSHSAERTDAEASWDDRTWFQPLRGMVPPTVDGVGHATLHGTEVEFPEDGAGRSITHDIASTANRRSLTEDTDANDRRGTVRSRPLTE